MQSYFRQRTCIKLLYVKKIRRKKNFVLFTFRKKLFKFYQNPDPHQIRIRIRLKFWTRIRIRTGI
jgi:hypothetical protein